jgi:hypothetical protein
MGADRVTLGMNSAPKVPKSAKAIQACTTPRITPSINRATTRIQKPA